MAQSPRLTEIPRHASVSALLVDLETGRELYHEDADRLLVPASLMKLVTTSAALEKLTPAFHFTTRIWHTGTLDKGTLNGNIVVEGGGDPTFGSRFFAHTTPAHTLQKVRSLLQQSGIRRLNGNILIDEHLFEAPLYPSPRLWEDMGNYYGAPPAPLTFRDNTFALTLQSPPRVGEPCKVVNVVPHNLPMTFVSRVKAAAHQKDSAYIYGVPGLKQWEIRGSIPAGRAAFTIKGTLPDPGLLFGREVYHEIFRGQPVGVSYTADTLWRTEASLLGEIHSPPLSEIVREINMESNNLMADHLLPALALHQGVEGSFWDVGPRIIKDYWYSRGNSAPVEIFDGSGLAPSNALSARFLVQVLAQMYESKHARHFINSLPVSGVSGTLKYMWSVGDLKGHVHAKSGSMRNVMGYAGYILIPGKPPGAFALLVNHHGLENSEIRMMIEKKLEQMVRHGDLLPAEGK